MENCNHVGKVLEWGLDENFNYKPSKWGCTKCNATSDIAWPDAGQWESNTDHDPDNSWCDCFACKVRTLELNTGDAGRAESMSQKKWDAELKAYKAARAEGIQPAGTTMKAINEAKQASDNLGRAFNAENMGNAAAMTKQKAKAMNEVGL